MLYSLVCGMGCPVTFSISASLHCGRARRPSSSSGKGQLDLGMVRATRHPQGCLPAEKDCRVLLGTNVTPTGVGEPLVFAQLNIQPRDWSMPAGKPLVLVGYLHSYNSKLLIQLGKPCLSAEGNAGFVKQTWMKLPKTWLCSVVPLACCTALASSGDATIHLAQPSPSSQAGPLLPLRREEDGLGVVVVFSHFHFSR